MLPGAFRLRSAQEFRRTIRSGVRAGRPTLVVSIHRPDPTSTGVRVGFVVSKAVGNAVIRNRVKRRLRHLARPLLDVTPEGVRVVVRALPAAAAPDAELERDLGGAWSSCLDKLGRTS
ncbi:ribonuclease P protein component [Ammonicoccus fulvus]|uniref:Ribonuclease P protein component n=1 Tax=Ammonicoccus fulvus TaxID=3138240 RepID=A0ABZ3FTF0_9ACTN